jgi:hypothetical protein
MSSGRFYGLVECEEERVGDFVTRKKSKCGADDERNPIAGNEKMIDCHKCDHYYVTWDKHFPHGCSAMKFKSKELPALAVLASSQMDCLLFKEKVLPKGKRRDRGMDKGKRA